MSRKTIKEALAEVQKRLDEAPVVSLGQLNTFRQKVGNPNATLGQYMNNLQGKTAKTGGVNDPDVIAKGLKASSPSQMGPGENRTAPQPYRPNATATAPKFTPSAPAATSSVQQPPRPVTLTPNAPAPLSNIDQVRSMRGTPVTGVSGNPITTLAPKPMTPSAQGAAETPKANPAYDRSSSPQFSQPGLSQYGQLSQPLKDTPVKAKMADEETKKGKTKVTESKLISAFLALQETNSSNIFEAAKKLSPKQKEIASLAGDKNKIDASDLKKLRSTGLKEDDIGDMINKMPKPQQKAPTNVPTPPTRPKDLGKKTVSDDPASITGMRTMESVEGSAADIKKDKAGAKKYGLSHKEWEKSKMDKKQDKGLEESLFSEAELAHLASIEEAIAKTSDAGGYITQRGGEGDRLGPTLGNQLALTDEKSKKASK